MCGEQGFKAVHKTVHWVKIIGKGCLIFLFEWLCYATSYLQNVKYCGIYLATQQQNKLTQFLVCANVSVLLSLEILPQACEKHIQTQISVLEYYTARNNVVSCFSRDPISVTFFDQVALFSDFNHLFEWFGPGFAPYSSSTFYIISLKNKAQETL